jgi:hypothetical protein
MLRALGGANGWRPLGSEHSNSRELLFIVLRIVAELRIEISTGHRCKVFDLII